MFPAEYSTGSGYKGFNDTLALWGTNRIIDQQCGQTWLKTVAEAGKYYSSVKQMLGIQLVTWNDYEEGSEIESGIDNCVTVSATVAGTVASWSITGQMNTVDHFTVFASQDGANLMWLADVPTTTSSLNLASFGLNAGNYIDLCKGRWQSVTDQQDFQRRAGHYSESAADCGAEHYQLIDEKFCDRICGRASQHHGFYGRLNRSGRQHRSQHHQFWRWQRACERLQRFPHLQRCGNIYDHRDGYGQSGRYGQQVSGDCGFQQRQSASDGRRSRPLPAQLMRLRRSA